MVINFSMLRTSHLNSTDDNLSDTGAVSAMLAMNNEILLSLKLKVAIYPELVTTVIYVNFIITIHQQACYLKHVSMCGRCHQNSYVAQMNINQASIHQI